MSTVTLPPIGAKIRVTSKRPDGTTVTIEGLVSSHPMNSDGEWVEVGTPGVTAYLTPDSDDRAAGATVAVEVLSQPEPADGTWLTVPNREVGRPPYVFHRDDAAAAVLCRIGLKGYHWYFHEDSDWVTWVEVQQRGEFTVLKAGEPR